MARLLILLLHNLLYPVLLVLMAPAALRKMKARGGRGSDLWQRFGVYDDALKSELRRLAAGGPVWWMHAVSVGEIGVAAKLIRELQRETGAPAIVLSTTTPTGFAEGRKLAAQFPGRVCVIYNPLDLWFTVRRCLSLIKPEQLVLVEAEVWPNLVFAARRRGIPVALVNARLSPRSERRYAKVLPLVRPVFSLLSRVLVQEPGDGERWGRLGVARDRIQWVGSVKYDTAGQSEPLEQASHLAALLGHLGWRRDEPVLLGASTHPGEEVELARVFGRLRDTFPGLKLILVPRHAERAGAIAAELRATGLKVALRSGLEPAASESAPDCLLVDTTGELRAWLHQATAVVMGKSFLGKGGQNPAEAVTAGRPVLFGPHMENFTPLVDGMLREEGAIQVADFAELERKLRAVIGDRETAARLALRGAAALHRHDGATRKTATALRERQAGAAAGPASAA